MYPSHFLMVAKQKSVLLATLLLASMTRAISNRLLSFVAHSQHRSRSTVQKRRQSPVTSRFLAMPISNEEARRLAYEWTEAWNDGDLNSIMDHFAEDVKFYSPVAATIIPESNGLLQGKDVLRAYFLRALNKYGSIQFKIVDVLVGLESIAVYYESVNEMMACEIMYVDSDGKVNHVVNHYSNISRLE